MIRAAVGAAVTAQLVWGDFAATDPAGPTTTVAATKVDGTSVAPTSTTRTAVGSFTWAATSTFTTPDRLTLVWSATFSGVATSQATRLDVAGGYYHSLRELIAANPALAGTYSQDVLDAARYRAEVDAETIMGRAFVQRVEVETIVARRAGIITPKWWGIRSVRSLSVDGTAQDVTALTIGPCSISGTWPVGSTIVVAYVHGEDQPPRDLVEAVMQLTKVRAQAVASAIPDRAGRFIADNGRTFVLDAPSTRNVGIPEIQSVLNRYAIPGFA